MTERFSDEVLQRAWKACDYALMSEAATDWADGLAAMRAVLEEHLLLERPLAAKHVCVDCGRAGTDPEPHSAECFERWRQRVSPDSFSKASSAASVDDGPKGVRNRQPSYPLRARDTSCGDEPPADHLAWHGPDPHRMQALLRDISELLADAGVPGGTPLSQGVIWLRDRAERAEAK